jgi:O-acetylhomoserine (thiol)-lyase
VNYPGLSNHPHYKLAQQLLPKGAGSVLSFGLEGGLVAGLAFMDALQLATNLANVGDSRTLVLHPASTTHSRLDAAALKAAGISADMLRVSVGLEALADIQTDFSRGLKAALKATAVKE